MQNDRAILLAAASAIAVTVQAGDTAGKRAESGSLFEYDTSIRLVATPHTQIPDLDQEGSTPPIKFDTAIRPTPFATSSFEGLFADPIGEDDQPIIAEGLEEKYPGPFSIRFARGANITETGFGPVHNLPEDFSRPRATGERYTLSFEWIPAGADSEIQWLVLGGVHAGRVDLEGFDSTAGGGTFAIPTIGTGFRWAPTDSLSFSTIASTQTHEQDGNLVDIAASAEIRLSPGVDFTAGYEYYRADISVDDLRSSLNREGVFAKITIRF